MTCLQIAHGGNEIRVENYEVLLREPGLFWEGSSHGNVPHNAVPGGRDGGELLYVGRTTFNGADIVGKVHPSHKCLYFPYGGKEHRSDHYTVLVHRR